MTSDLWTPETIELLTKLWNEGLSCSTISNRLGPRFTRNAVIGKVHRLHLARRNPSPPPGTGRRKVRHQALGEGTEAAAKSARPTPTISLAPIVKKPVPVKLVPPQPARTLHDGPVTLLDLGPQMCKWPIGDVGSSDFHFCGHKHDGDGPYCEYHASQAYSSAPSQKYRPFTPQHKRAIKAQLLARAS